MTFAVIRNWMKGVKSRSGSAVEPTAYSQDAGGGSVPAMHRRQP
jgi:hypothetical protein